MHRVLLPVAILSVALSFTPNTISAAPKLIALAPIPVAHHGDEPRTPRMLSMLAKRVEKLKADGKDDEAKVAIRRAHQRVRESEEQLNSQKDKLHEIVERLGKGQDADFEDINWPSMEKEFKALQKSAKKLVKGGKADEAEKLANGVHKKVREGVKGRTAEFAKLHSEIEKIGGGNFAAAGAGKDGHDGADGHDGKDGKDGHDGGHAHDEDGDHGDDHEHNHGDHDHGKELKELQKELKSIRKEIDEVRAMVETIRDMAK